MKYNDQTMAGGLILFGGAQLVFGLLFAETAHPGYSVSANLISDLGVGPAALIFNSSITLLGLTLIISAYFIQRAYEKPIITTLIGLTGLGAMGVGLFPENVPVMHGIAATVAFIFGGITAIAAYKVQKKPLAYFSVVMGLLSLSALILFALRENAGLGPGGMERMIIYPILVWAISFGGYQIGSTRDSTKTV